MSSKFRYIAGPARHSARAVHSTFCGLRRKRSDAVCRPKRFPKLRLARTFYMAFVLGRADSGKECGRLVRGLQALFSKRHADEASALLRSLLLNRALVLGFILAMGPGGSDGHAQDTNEVEQLKKQLNALQENFERLQREQRLQIDALTKKLEDLSRQQAAEAEKKRLEQELTAQLATNQAPASSQAPASAASTGWSPSEPLTVARAGSA